MSLLGPAHKSGQISLGLDVLTDGEVARPLLEQGVHHLLGHHLLDSEGGGRNLLAPLLSFLLDHCFTSEICCQDVNFSFLIEDKFQNEIMIF